MTPAYDAALGLIYIGAGNPAQPDIDAASRPGDTHYTSSIVALGAAPGTTRCYDQLGTHDRWDHDVANPLLLAEVTIDGVQVPAVAHAAKTGWVHVPDRRTGRNPRCSRSSRGRGARAPSGSAARSPSRDRSARGAR
jgi:glucose dehydrogenase